MPNATSTGSRTRSNFQPAHPDRLRLFPEDLGVYERCRQVFLGWARKEMRPQWLKLVHSPVRALLYRWISPRLSREGLAAVMVAIVYADREGYPESELRAPARCLDELVDELKVGNNHRSLDELDLIEDDLEAAENHATLRRRIEGDTPALLREAAEINRREAQVQLERARLLEREARIQERQLQEVR